MRKRLSGTEIAHFRRVVRAFYLKNKRDLPWRKASDPYHVLVSEIMLQQTQVSRVCQKFPFFISTFPTIKSLAKAPLREVLSIWSGLGYNRRAKFLHELAKIVIQLHKEDYNELERNKDFILNEIKKEDNKFRNTL